MTKPIILHRNLSKDERRVRIPDASDKDKKIAACTTLGSFYKNRENPEYRRVKSNYKSSTRYTLEDEDDDDRKVVVEKYPNPPILFHRQINNLIVRQPRRPETGNLRS